MTGNSVFDFLLLAEFACAAFVIMVLFLVDAPYGRHKRAGWGPSINTRLGWIIMESPAALCFLYFFCIGQNARSIVPILLLLMWQLHYFHRAFIYPFLIKVKEGDKTPFAILAPGALFCGINGFLNGAYVSNYATYLNNEWLTDPRFIIGVILFGFGYYLNKHSDKMLRDLRAQSSDEYKIPYGFGFKLVSMPNYLGEIVTWTGFAIASWSLAGLAFVVFTMANLVPRAIANHKWYQAHFAEYPKDRKAIIPFVL